jgi:peroxiredoxin
MRTAADRGDSMAQFHATELQRAFQQARDLDGSLAERLDLFAAAVRRHNPSFDAVVERLIARLRQHQAGANAPKAGDMMPPFELPDETGRMTSLAGLLAQGPAVVTFHRGHWCPYCRLSIRTLAQAQDEIAARGARMVAIVPERSQFAAEMKDEAGAGFPILIDMDNGYAMSLNLAIFVGVELRDYMSALGRSLPEYQGNDSWTLPIPATFVVGQDGRIRTVFVDPDFRRRMTLEQLTAALQ